MQGQGDSKGGTEASGKGLSQEPGDSGHKGRLREPVPAVIQLHLALQLTACDLQPVIQCHCTSISSSVQWGKYLLGLP